VRVGVLSLIFVLTVSCSSDASDRSLPTPPSDVAIATPVPGVPKRSAAFSGTWEGSWGERLPSRLVVEHINKRSIQVVYAWGDAIDGSFEAGWARVSGEVLSEGKIGWGREDVRFTFTMAKDLVTISGVRELSGVGVARVTMKKVG
jgi:hypothetical protein